MGNFSNPLLSVNLRDLIAQRTGGAVPQSDARVAAQQPVPVTADSLQNSLQRIKQLADTYSTAHPHAAFGSTSDTLNPFITGPAAPVVPPVKGGTGTTGTGAGVPLPAPVQVTPQSGFPSPAVLQSLAAAHRGAAFDSSGARRRTLSDFRRKDLDSAIGKHEGLADMIDSFRSHLQQHQGQQTPIQSNQPSSPLNGAPIVNGVEDDNS